MKHKLVIGFFILAISSVCTAQRYKSGDYLVNTNIDKFVGTWKWQSGNDIVIIKLKKVKYLFPIAGFFQDQLFGAHSYIQNGVVIESTLDEFDLLGPDRMGSILLYNVASDPPDYVEGTILDITKGQKGVKLILTYVAGSTPQAIWTTGPHPHRSYDQAGFTLPRDIALVKQ